MFAVLDMMVIGFIKRLKEFGVDVFKKVLVVGFDDIFLVCYIILIFIIIR